MLPAMQVISIVVLLQSVLIGHSLSPSLLSSDQILVVHINKTLSNDDNIYHDIKATNPNISTICTVHRNESNTNSFTSLYIRGYTNTMHLNDIVSFHHIMHMHDVPYSCIDKVNNITHVQTKQMRNTNYIQTPIDIIPDNNNKVFANANYVSVANMCACPNKVWDYFKCSLREWWLIYVIVLLIGIVVGALSITLIIYCCWRSKKKKFIKQIISNYKKTKKANGVSDAHRIEILHKTNGKKNKYDGMYIDIHPDGAMHKKKRKKEKKRSKYALVAVNDGKDNSNKRRDKNRQRRKTVPTTHPISNVVEQSGYISEEENHLLQLPSRMKSHSDPFNPHQKNRNSRSNRHKKSSKRAHKSRSRSPFKHRSNKMNVNHDDTYEEYRFQGNNSNKSQLLQPQKDYDQEHRRPSSKSSKSSKSKKRNKNKKRNRSKSPAVHVDRNRNEDDIEHKQYVMPQDHHMHHHNACNVDDHYNIDLKHYINHGGLPKLAAVASAGESKTKKSIGIDLAQMKAKNYEENRKESMQANNVGVTSLEMHNMAHNHASNAHESDGDERDDDMNNSDDMVIHEGVCLEIKNRKKDDIVIVTRGYSHHMESLTNINDEGIAGIDNILSDMKQMNEESSSFTVKSGDIVSPNEKGADEAGAGALVDENGNLFIPTNTKRIFKLPKTKTKRQWM